MNKVKFKPKEFNLKILPRLLEHIQSLDNEEYEVSVSKVRKSRSQNANSYLWVLLDKLAVKLNMRKEDIYRELIKDVGGNSEFLPIRNDAVDKWVACWEQKGIGWVCDVIGDSKLDGYTNVICYYGSSTYDTEQMSRLINLVVEECMTQGIQTMTPQEMSLLLEEWK